MASDPEMMVLMRRFLHTWDEDNSRGITTRSIYEKLAEHIKDDREYFDSIRRDIQALRESEAEQRGFESATGSGRYALAGPATPRVASHHSFHDVPMVAVNVGPAGAIVEREERTTKDWHVWTRRVLAKPAGVALLTVLSALAGWLVNHLGVIGH
jgi:hypothetical protein